MLTRSHTAKHARAASTRDFRVRCHSECGMFDDNDGLIDDNVVFESEVLGMPHRSERIFSGIGFCDTKRSRSTSQIKERT